MLSAGCCPVFVAGTGREISSPYIDKPGILTPIFHSLSGVHVRIVQQLLLVRSVPFQVLYLPVVQKGFPGTNQVVHQTNQVVRTTPKRPSENTVLHMNSK